MSDLKFTKQPSDVDSPLPILSLVFAFIAPLVGAILGHVALKQMREGRISSTNEGLAKAGMIVGWVLTGLYFLLAILYGVLIIALISDGYSPTDF